MCLVREPQNKLLGVGLDNEDQQVRITRGKNFHLVGGSKQTHESMQEKCIKMDEKLQARNKQFGDLEDQELLDLAGECDIHIANLDRRGTK